MNEDHKLKAPIIFTIISAVVFLMLGIFGMMFLRNSGDTFLNTSTTKFEKFASDDEFREYLNDSTQGYGVQFMARGFGAGEAADMALTAPALGGDLSVAQELGNVERLSQTNVQVVGLDEPDIVKSDGNNIYFSSENYYLFGRGAEPFIAEDLAVSSDERMTFPAPDFPDYVPPTTKVIDALPPESVSLTGKIDTTGDLLLSGNTLMVISYNEVTGYDVSDPANPTQLWQHQFDENHQYNTARLLNGEVYLVTTRYADYGMPCPMPLLTGSTSLTVPCTDIYRIGRPISADTIFSVVKMNPQTGSVNDSMTFVGSSGQSVIYMSPNSIYATFTSYPSPLEFMGNFFSQNTDLMGSEVSARISNLNNIDISNESKVNELSIIIQKHLNSLSNDERQRVESELANRMNDYIKVHGRELQRTSIVKINANNLDIAAMGEVAGAPLNQFSLDEHNGNLRMATTLNANTMFGSGESANDVYVMDSNLSVIGQIQNLALGERVYSARFIGDQAYIVTFKQIDPFFVIDLSNPQSPRVSGELKIPGFSSYLHPLTGNLILGVGQEESQSKLSVFDVSSPNNPVEIYKYTLPEFWSEVQNNHHAFLHDPERQIFFIPAGAGGYVFSYDEGLTLERVVADISARRALYINNYLYILGDQKMVVLNQDNWQQVGTLEF